MAEFYIISVKHTQRKDPYITIWGPDDRGYRQRLNTAGRYNEERVRANLGYYNSGCGDIAVPADVVERQAVDGDPAWFIGANPVAGNPRVLRNDRGTWHALLANVIEPPAYKPKPQYPGARRRKEAA